MSLKDFRIFAFLTKLFKLGFFNLYTDTNVQAKNLLTESAKRGRDCSHVSTVL